MLGGALQSTSTFRRPEERTSFGTILVLVVSGLTIAICGTGYIMQMNFATSKGYEIKKLEQAVVKMRAENAKLSIGVATEQSMDTQSAKINMMGMVDVGTVEYVMPPGPVAVAR